jgi:hypothetical protein
MTKTVKYKQDKKLRMPRAVKQAIISTLVLLLLAVGSALGYVWYSGMQEPVLTDPTLAETTSKDSSPIKHVQVAANAKVGVAVQYISIPVVPGDNAMVTVRTLPAATCKIGVLYNGNPSNDSGLIQRTADDYGTASWTWTVPVGTPLGSWPVTITCERNKSVGVVTTDLVVAKQAPLATQ